MTFPDDAAVERAIKAHNRAALEWPFRQLGKSSGCMRAALAAAIPPGYVLVPREPTAAMCGEGYEDMWHALIAAAEKEADGAQ